LECEVRTGEAVFMGVIFHAHLPKLPPVRRVRR
jgi:hypothetical protein